MKSHTTTPLSKQQLEAFKLRAVPCESLSHYPAVTWFASTEVLATSYSAVIHRSKQRVIEWPNGKAIYKPATSTSYVIKTQIDASQKLLRELADQSMLSLHVPYAKQKPPTIRKLSNGKYLLSMVMAELTGKTAADLLFQDEEYRLRKFISIPAVERLEIMLEAAWCTQSEIHASGLVHRDITPANIMINRLVSPPCVRVFDFDHCKQVGVEDDACHGTPLFMSPEAYARRVTTFKTDVFGLAWFFYLLLDGKMSDIQTEEGAEFRANSHKIKRLFGSIKDQLSKQEKAACAKLLVSMFAPKRKNRCDLQHCIDVIENILLRRKLQSMEPNEREHMRKAYSLGKQLRLKLLRESFKLKVGDYASSDLVHQFDLVFRNNQIKPSALPMFLAALRVDALKGMTSVSAIMQQVKNTAGSFALHYAELVKLQRVWLGAENQMSLDYFMAYYSRFFYSFDNMMLLDHKLVKMLHRMRQLDKPKVESKSESSALSSWASFWPTTEESQAAPQSKEGVYKPRI